MKIQKIKKFQTAEEMASYLFNETFKVDLDAGVYPTPADELKGEVLNLFTKKYLDKLFSVQYNGLSNKDNKTLRKWNTILFVGFLSQVQDNLSDEVLREVDSFIDKNWKYLINYKDVVGVSELCGYILEDLLTVYIDRLKQIKNKKEFKKQFVYFIAFINDVKRERNIFQGTFTEKSRKLVDDFIDKHYRILFNIRFIKKELNKHNLQISDIMYVNLYNSYDLKSKNYGKCGFMDKLNSISQFYYCLHNCRGIDRLFRFNYFIESRFSSEYSGDKKIIL